MSWNSLPPEIQTHILEALLLHQDTARYASTCRAWQATIERRNFACLKATQSRLADFGDIGYRHQHLVDYTWYSIEPTEYYCPHCGDVSIPSWQQAPTIRKAIQDLIIQLSRWEARDRLLLDISVKAPSALRHSSSPIQYGPVQHGPGIISSPRKAQMTPCLHWLHDTSLQGPIAYLLSRITDVSEPEPEPEPRPSDKMPKAAAVTSLLLRRQTRRIWKPEMLEELLHLLPSIQEIHYEPWRYWRRMEGRPSDTCKPLDDSRVDMESFAGYFVATMQLLRSSLTSSHLK